MQPHLRIRVDSPSSGRKPGAADIVASVSRSVGSGELPACGRLPPVRVLAHQLGISKNTVTSAYDELVARGIAANESRRGYFVSAPRRAGRAHARSVEPGLPELTEARSPEASRPRPGVIDLGNVFVDPALLPRERIADCFRSVLRTPGIHSFYDRQGYPPLREAIAARLTRRGIPARPDEVIITSGSQQALDIVCRALARKHVATENPAYAIGKRLFEMSASAVTGLRLDPFAGVDLGSWERAVRRARPSLLYLTTNFQNPTGYSYTTAELLAVLAMSREHGFGLLEDDWGSDMLSFSEFRPPMRALGGPGVLYMSSFTKKLLPSLRLGYLVAPEPLVGPLVEAKRVATLGCPTLVEAALFEFLDRGYFDRHLSRMQQVLDGRYGHCLEALRDRMPDEVRWTTPGGGPLLWVELPRTVDLGRLEERLARRRVRIECSRSAFFGDPHLHGFRLGYAFLPEAELAKGLQIAADAVRAELTR